MEGTVTLSKEEYDRLKKIQMEHELSKNSPEEFVKIEYPDYDWREHKPVYKEIRVYSGETAVLRLKENFEHKLEELENRYKQRLKDAEDIQNKYKGIISAVDNFKKY